MSFFVVFFLLAHTQKPVSHYIYLYLSTYLSICILYIYIYIYIIYIYFSIYKIKDQIKNAFFFSLYFCFHYIYTHYLKGFKVLLWKLLTRTLKLVMLVGFNMLLKVFHISFMSLFWRLVKAADFAQQD